MKTFDIASRAAASKTGEYVLGLNDLGTHACYMIYGTLKPGERGRVLKPGSDHEEVICAVKGTLKLTGHFNGTLAEGSAIHLREEETCEAENPSATEIAIYIAAGGHAEHGHGGHSH